MDASHKAKIASAHRGTHQKASTKKKISKTMKGTSNFAGKTHSTKSKDRIRHKRGHDDRIKGRMWAVNSSGKTTRAYEAPRGYKRHKRIYSESILSFKQFLVELD